MIQPWTKTLSTEGEQGFEYIARWYVMAYVLARSDGRMEIPDEALDRLRVTEVRMYRDEARAMTVLEAR